VSMPTLCQVPLSGFFECPRNRGGTRYAVLCLRCGDAGCECGGSTGVSECLWFDGALRDEGVSEWGDLAAFSGGGSAH
jgi:hypothetical protein